MLQARESIPHFEVRRLGGASVRYDTIWQRKNLLLVVLPQEQRKDAEAYAARLAERTAQIAAHDAECVITKDSVAGVPRPGAVVADRWGEVHFVAGPPDVTGLPSPDELIDWLAYVQVKCPECEGESR